MKNLAFPPGDLPRTVLCVGAHCDDIEIGCGGTILEWAQRDANVRFHCVVLSGDETRHAETRSALAQLVDDTERLTVDCQSFRDGFFPAEWPHLKEYFESLKPIAPDVVLTHHERDRHQDHRSIAELVWNTFRNHLVLEYEIPKFDGDLHHPSTFVEISEANARRKARIVSETFVSQRGKDWFDAESFLSMMRLRGLECRAGSRYAEAFHVRKVRLSLAPDGTN